MLKKTGHSTSGVTLVEVIFGVSIVVVVVLFVGLTLTQFTEVRNNLMDEARKAYLAEEGYEILRLLRDEAWSNLTAVPVSSTRYLDVSTTTLAISTTPEIIDGEFTRNFRLLSVYRNGSGEVVASTTPGAVLDNEARQVEISVGNSVSTTTYTALLMDFSSL